MKNRVGWIQISPEGVGRRVFVQAMHKPLIDAWKNEKNYIFSTLIWKLDGLSADAVAGRSLNFSGNIKSKLLEDGSEINYFIDDSDVLINQIKLSKSTGLKASGIREVVYSDQGWQTKDTLLSSMNLDKTWPAVISESSKILQGEAHFSAISGVYEDAAKAGELLGDHVTGAYGDQLKQFNKTVVEQEGNSYSLLYLNKGDHTSKTGKYLLKTVIQQNAAANARVHTLVQGLAAKTFVSTAEGLRGSLDQSAMKKQQFYFSNPEGVSELKLKSACEAIGATYAGTRFNPYDIRQKTRCAVGELRNIELNFRNLYKCVTAVGDAGLKTAEFVGKNLGKISTAAVGSMVIKKITDIAEFTELMAKLENVEQVTKVFVDSFGGNEQAILYGIGALVIISTVNSAGKFAYNHYKNAKAISKSTFGSANQIWFENEKSFKAIV